MGTQEDEEVAFLALITHLNSLEYYMLVLKYLSQQWKTPPYKMELEQSQALSACRMLNTIVFRGDGNHDDDDDDDDCSTLTNYYYNSTSTRWKINAERDSAGLAIG